MTLKRFFFLCANIYLFSFSVFAQVENTPEIKTPIDVDYTLEKVVDSLIIPWSIEFITENDILVSEKQGKIYRIKKGIKQEVIGLPKDIYSRGQGGLLDIAISPNFAKENRIYFTTASNLEGENRVAGNTALYTAILEGNTLIDLQLLYKAIPNTRKGHHFGSRIVFDEKGYLYFSVGDRGERDINPQDITKDGGKIYRVHLDGKIPEDNPFISKPLAKKAVYSYGHRNPQGMVYHKENKEVWVHEHGPKGGDEINVIQKGKNYGWPKITYGKNYSGTTITNDTIHPNMEPPLYYWVPSIAPSGMAFSTSGRYPKWKGNLFVGSLKFQYVERIVLKDRKVVEREKIAVDIGRVRDIKESPDGFLYIAVEQKGIFKIIKK